MIEEIELDEIAKLMVRATQKAMVEDFKAPNFVTTTIVDTETNEKFEFTVRRHEGMTPGEKLRRQSNTLERIKDIIKINRRGRVTDSHTLERIERALTAYEENEYD